MSLPPRGSVSPRDGMADFRLSDRARADLIDIYDFTEGAFGPYQAEAYHAGLERTFGLLADFPRIGPSVDELRPGYRRQTPFGRIGRAIPSPPRAGRRLG